MNSKRYYYQDMSTILIVVCIMWVLTILEKTVLDVYPPSILLLSFSGKTYAGPKIQSR